MSADLVTVYRASSGEDMHRVLCVLAQPHVAAGLWEYGENPPWGGLLGYVRGFADDKNNHIVMIEECDDTIAVFMNRYMSRGVYQIHPFTDERFCGKGQSHNYMEENLEYLRMAGVEKVFGFPPWTNFATCRLFEKCGFETEGRMKDSWLTGHGRVDRMVYGFRLEE